MVLLFAALAAVAQHEANGGEHAKGQKSQEQHPGGAQFTLDLGGVAIVIHSKVSS